MKLNDSIEKLKFDSRVVEWNVKNHVIAEKDLKNHLEKLPDLSDQVAKVEIDE